MTDNEYGQNRYLEDSINTATPEKLALMLYEAALKNVRECRTSMAENPMEGLAKSQLSRDILSALADNVNMSHPHGARMRSLYLYCWRQVVTATSQNQPQELEIVEEVLQNLMEGIHQFNQHQVVRSISEAEETSINFAG